MDIQVTHEQRRVLVTVFGISGAIDSSNYQELDVAASSSIDSGARHILLDLSKVRFMSSAALRSLQKMDKKLKALSDGPSPQEEQEGLLSGVYHSPFLKLLNPSEQVLFTLKTAGWDMVFDIFKDRHQALGSF
jgi:hypothetical protein